MYQLYQRSTADVSKARSPAKWLMSNAPTENRDPGPFCALAREPQHWPDADFDPSSCAPKSPTGRFRPTRSIGLELDPEWPHLRPDTGRFLAQASPTSLNFKGKRAQRNATWPASTKSPNRPNPPPPHRRALQKQNPPRPRARPLSSRITQACKGDSRFATRYQRV